MTKINNVIEINGKRYDSQTGVVVGKSSAPTTAAMVPKQGRRIQTVDGFMPASAPKAAKPKHVSAIPVAPIPAKSSARHTAHHGGQKLAAHQPEHSKTLMRHTVKAPAIKSQKVESVQAPADVVKFRPKVLGVKPKLSSDNVDDARAERAQNVPRSGQVIRFQRQSQMPSRPVIAAPATQAALIAPVASVAKPATLPASVPSRGLPAPIQRTQNNFEQAIANATSHEQPEHREATAKRARRGIRRHVRLASISAIVLAVLLLGGFIAYQNKVEIKLQLASARAGFAASMPGFRPTGYAAKTLTYGPGKVSIGYSGPHNKSYAVVQKSSNWDSETLLQNYVATSGLPYDAYSDGGRTVYVFGNGDATWVSAGVWYEVVGNGNLGKKQVMELATSM